MLVMVVDGQGGGVGRALIEKLKEKKADLNILAAGTNSIATAAMLKAGADNAATGENAVIFNAPKADIITGSIGIISANSMLGELSPAMAAAIASSGAVKILIPNSRCSLLIAGVLDEPLEERIKKAARMILEHADGR